MRRTARRACGGECRQRSRRLSRQGSMAMPCRGDGAQRARGVPERTSARCRAAARPISPGSSPGGEGSLGAVAACACHAKQAADADAPGSRSSQIVGAPASCASAALSTRLQLDPDIRRLPCRQAGWARATLDRPSRRQALHRTFTRVSSWRARARRDDNATGGAGAMQRPGGLMREHRRLHHGGM